ncbi:MAG: dTDP-4-dehydrorhamnose 3,5-epimerase [Bacteroidota bacterium]
MELIPTPLKDLFIIQPRVFEDARGYFFESYSKKLFEQAGINTEFVQDNQSMSQKNVLRGLHFQNPPYAQGKLVRVLKGAVLDVAVDIRKKSATYGRHLTMRLDEKNKTMLFIPPGFAHGFLTLEDETVFFYKCTNFYHKQSESTLLWNDPELNIRWGVSDPILSDKDKNGTPFRDLNSMF